MGMVAICQDSIKIHHKEKRKLYAEFYNAGNNAGQRHNEPGKIYFTKQPGIGCKRAGRTAETAVKEIPDGYTPIKKQEHWYTISGKFGYFAKDEHISKGAENGREKMP